MPMFFFHIRDGTDLILDKSGTDLPDIAAAEIEAKESARYLLADLSDIGARDGQHFEVCDCDGSVVAVVPFCGAG